MGKQMTIPFTVLSNGAVSVETDTNLQVGQRVHALVATELGQRAMRAGLGLPLSRLLFSQIDTLSIAELRDQVTQLLGAYEPGVNVLSVVPVAGETKDGRAEIKVNYQPILQGSAARAVTDVAVIEVGGTVKEINLNGNR